MNSYDSCSLEEGENEVEPKPTLNDLPPEIVREAKLAVIPDPKHQQSRRNFSIMGAKASMQPERESGGAYTAYVGTIEHLLSSLLGCKILLMKNT